ncbi:MAG: glycosyl hydrolase family 28-related protein [Phycisphaerales bacterium]
MRTRDLVLSAALLVGFSADAARAQVTFPPGVRVVDASLPPYNATPNDNIDDTAAINAALNAPRPAGASALTVYLPDGVYNVSNTILYPTPRITLQGQSQNGTIIRLAPNLPAYAGPGGKRVVSMREPGGFSANEFRKSIYDLTIEVGPGNPGAVGLLLHCSNQGGARNVTVRSLDPARLGLTGIDMNGSDKGPGMLRNVRVEGFDTGISMGGTEYSMTFENITLLNQRVFGIDNIWNILCIRGLNSNNTVPAIRNRVDGTNFFEWGMVTLIDANLTGGAAGTAAIVNEARLYARNITTSGYAAAISRDGVLLPGTNIPGEHIDQRAISIWPTSRPPASLGLPVAAFPEQVWDNPANLPGNPAGWWANVENFGALGTDNNTIDDAIGIQAAIDSGATTVVLPAGRYYLKSTVVLRGSVRRLMGMESSVEAAPPLSTSAGMPMFKTDIVSAPVVLVERLQTDGIGSAISFEHRNPGTLAIRNMLLDAPYVGANRGDFHAEDVVGGPWNISDGQRAWFRQLNPENSGTKMFNDGGDVWVLGFKTEKPGTIVRTTSAGKTEILGGLIYPVNDLPLEQPMFVCDKASMSVVVGESAYGPNAFHKIIAEVTRGTALRRLFFNEIPRRTGNGWGAALCVFTEKFDSAPVLPGPVAHYPMNETSGNVVPDLLGGLSGFAFGGPSWVPGLPGLLFALDFDGVDDHVVLPNNLASAARGAVSMWIKTGTDFNDLGMLFYATNTANPNADGVGPEPEVHLNMAPNDTVFLFIEGGAFPDIVMGNGFTLNDNQWHHIVASWDTTLTNGVPGFTEIYVDGKRTAVTQQQVTDFPFAAVTRLGRPTANARYYDGVMDDVRVYDRPVEHAEVMDLYFGGLGYTNYPPAVDAGPDLVVQNPTSSIALQGQVNDDNQPGGTPPVVLWNTVSGPGTVTYADVTSPTTTVTFPTTGAYVLRLRAQDPVSSATDDVTVNFFDPLPPPWDNRDIDAFPFGWTITNSNALVDSFSINSSGSRIDGFPAAGCDSFHFTYQPISAFNNITVTARIDAVPANNANSRAGVMFRQDLGGCAANVFLGLTRDGRLIYSNRSGGFGGTDVTTITSGLTAPVWVRMTRINANAARGAWSTDGVRWTELPDRTANTGVANTFLGLASSAYANSIGASTFSVVSLGAPCVGDVNSDRAVNTADLTIFLGAFGSCTGAPGYVASADFDSSGCVNTADLTSFLGRFGLTCP